MKMSKMTDNFHVVPERHRKPRVLHSQSSHEKIMKKAATRRGSMDVSVSPVVSLKKRGSMRNRRGSEFFGSMNNVKKSSVSSDKRHSNSNNEIVTPFAQILAKLNSVLQYMLHQNAFDNINNNKEVSINRMGANEELKISLMPLRIDQNNETEANDSLEDEKSNALEDIMWCLEQLKKLQTHNSVSNMAIDQFRKVLYDKQISSDSDVAQQVFEFLKSYDNDVAHKASSSSNLSVNSEEKCIDSVYDRPKSSTSAIPIQTSGTDRKDKHAKEKCVSKTQHARSQGQKFGDLVRLGSMDGKTWSISSGDQMNGELNSLLQTINQWGMNVFRLSDLTNNRPLTVLGYNIFKSRGLLQLLDIKENVFIKYFTALEGSYKKDVPYHNNFHATDVMHSVHVLLNSKSLQNVFSPLETVAALFSAAIHDVDHPGLTNQYLINTNSELALLYNDISVLENHHVSTAFKLLRQDECNIFEHINQEDWHKLRKLTIDIVLATDMSKHMTLLANMKTMIESHMVDITDSGGNLHLDNYNYKCLILQNMVHCADLGNPTKPLELYRRWTNQVFAEFFLQGDKEREKGLRISPNCDRNKVSINESQIGFFDFIVRPVWETLADLVHSDVQEMLDKIDENRTWHEANLKNPPSVFPRVSRESNFSDLKEENES